VTTIEHTGPVLAGPLLEHLGDLRIDLAEDRIQVGDRILEAANLTALRSKLSSALYDVWHAGTAGRDDKRLTRRRDSELERELVAAIPHQSAPILGKVGTGSGVVEVNRVRILVPAEALTGRATGDPIQLELPPLRPMLSPGFLFVTGSAGGTGGSAVLRLYIHVIAAEHAPQIWRTSLQHLESAGARYRAKVLSQTVAFPRRDAIVVYLPESSWPHAPELASALDGAAGVGAETSVLAHRIGPGLAMAWEPTDNRAGWRRMSFGQHRSTAVARGVTRHVRDSVPLHAAVAEELTEAGIDTTDPARNLDSPAFPDRSTS
jgi:hypothetical protein